MQIADLTLEWIEQAERLAMENYEEERSAVPCLPDDPLLPSLKKLAENGLGVAAVEDGKLLGFLGAYGPFEPVFCTRSVCGVFSPVHAHAVQTQERAKIWRRLYQAAAKKWVRAGATSHAVTLYTHDVQAQTALFQYGFGMRCMDLMRDLSSIEAAYLSGCTFGEWKPDCAEALRSLRKALAEHLAQSPSFMQHDEEALNKWLQKKEASAPRIFAAEHEGRPIAYMEIEDEGETFASCAEGTQNICGAYCLPDFRGTGVAAALLAYMISTLKKEGTVRLGVDCESFNPTAFAFWNKYFTPYTHSLVRRIDENALNG